MSPRLLPFLLPLFACKVDRDIELTPDLEVVVEGNNAFTADLYGAAAAEGDENLFLSPFSVYSALGMTLAGAEGTTEEEMRDVLHVGEDEDSFHTNLGLLTQDLDGRFKGYEIAIGNRLFGQEGLGWEADFLDRTAEDYGAELAELDFQQDPEGARADINGWVSDQTRGNIDELLGAGTITAATRAVLANAIWFKGDWAEAFEEDATREKDFTRADGSVVTVDMMQGELPARYGTFSGGKVLVLPYEGEEVSMFAILPDAIDGLPALEGSLDGETLSGLLDEAGGADVDIGLPRLELRLNLGLKDLLTDLGMPTAFSDGADLSGMVAGGGLKIDDVIHEAWVKVDESGTEAAAATAVTVMTTDAGPSEAPEFIADHPFIFGIRDDLTGAILFIGRVADPNAG